MTVRVAHEAFRPDEPARAASRFALNSVILALSAILLKVDAIDVFIAELNSFASTSDN
jgi:hypothetical protein